MYYIVTWILIGLLLGILFLYLNRSFNVRRERINLTIGLVVAAIIYIGFAIVWGNFEWIGIEILGVIGYSIIAWLGLRYHYAWIALGWGLHPLWDIGVHLFGPGVNIAPAWYAIACVSFDGLVAIYILASIKRLEPTIKSKDLVSEI